MAKSDSGNSDADEKNGLEQRKTETDEKPRKKSEEGGIVSDHKPNLPREDSDTDDQNEDQESKKAKTAVAEEKRGRESEDSKSRPQKVEDDKKDEHEKDYKRKERKEKKPRKEKDKKESERERERSERERDKSRKERDRDKERGRERRRRSRSRSRDRDRDRRRASEGRDRYRDREPDRRRSRSRSRDRRFRRSWSPERRKDYGRDTFRGRRRYRSPTRSRSTSADYGGYVPRKRQENAKVTDGPYSSSLGVNTFDKAPSVTQQKVTGLSAAPSTDPAEAIRQLQEQQLKARQLVLQQQAASAAAAASKTQREVYVGNLALGLVTEDVLRTLFNNALKVAFPDYSTPGMEPVVNVSMHSDGRYAFVELRTPEMASEALKISGLQLLGQALSVGRPSGYVDPVVAAQQAAQAAQALQQFQASKGLPVTPTSEINAAGNALPPVLPTSEGTAVAAAAPTGAQTAVGSAVPAAAGGGEGAAGAAAPAAPPATCICVENMFTAAVLMDDNEYVDVMQDLQEECAKAGNVADVKVPKPADSSMVGQGHYGKAFVQFSTPEQASAAKQMLDGRSFDGQTLRVTLLSAMPSA
uniref:RRM domain-containing protein n=1 Tax=Tetraselmis sp. GSL018 TaxID=582737 RepID=A0A061RZ22_9CHLO